jgi:hypothetical protein
MVEIWNNLEIWATEILGWYKQSLLGDSCGSSIDQNVDRNVNFLACPYEFSGGNENSWELD